MPNHVLLQEIEVSAATASVTFANIPQTGYDDLKVVITGRSPTSNTGYGRLSLLMAINGSSSTFTGRDFNGFGNEGSGSSTYTTGRCGWINANDATSNVFSLNEIYIPNYRSSTNKEFSIDYATENNNTGQMVQGMGVGLWSTTTSISSLTFTVESGNSFAQYSTFSLYGVATLGTTPSIAPKASGGNTITTDGTYWYHAFLTSGFFTPIIPLSCDILTIAGGGAGGRGGGGAGGLVYASAQTIAASAQTVTVGAGGAQRTSDGGGLSNPGTNSQFASLTAAVGGGAAAGFNVNGGAGGSGGGVGWGSGGGYSGGTATSGQGFAGGGGNGDGGGGGGGAGGAGATGATNNPGVGGVGSSTYSSWGLATLTGQNVSGTVFYAGGGGASGNTSQSDRAGGNGGGGTGRSSTGSTPSAGTANTGGGGGGGSGSTALVGGAGGSGIVIVRYAV